MATRWVYLFRDGDASQRDLLGGKGANLAEMTNAGLPVPPGFTITTEACNAYLANDTQLPDGLWEQTLAGITEIERQMKRSFGGDTKPGNHGGLPYWSRSVAARSSRCRG